MTFCTPSSQYTVSFSAWGGEGGGLLALFFTVLSARLISTPWSLSSLKPTKHPSLPVVQLCQQEAGGFVHRTLSVGWLTKGWGGGCPYDCTIMGIQDGREGPRKTTRENRGRQESYCQTRADRKPNDVVDSVFPPSVNRLLICFCACLDPARCMGGRGGGLMSGTIPQTHFLSNCGAWWELKFEDKGKGHRSPTTTTVNWQRFLHAAEQKIWVCCVPCVISERFAVSNLFQNNPL